MANKEKVENKKSNVNWALMGAVLAGGVAAGFMIPASRWERDNLSPLAETAKEEANKYMRGGFERISSAFSAVEGVTKAARKALDA